MNRSGRLQNRRGQRQHGGGLGSLFKKLRKNPVAKSLVKQTATGVAGNMLQGGSLTDSVTQAAMGTVGQAVGQAASQSAVAQNALGAAAMLSQGTSSSTTPPSVPAALSSTAVSQMMAQYQQMKSTLADVSSRLVLLEKSSAERKAIESKLIQAVKELKALKPDPAAMQHATQTVKATAAQAAMGAAVPADVQKMLTTAEYAERLVQILSQYDGTQYKPDHSVVNMLSKAIDHQRRLTDLSKVESSGKFINDLLNQTSDNQQAQTLVDLIRTARRTSPATSSGPTPPVLSEAV